MMIELKKITKTYQGKEAVSNLTLTIDAGELFVLVGHSGSGKTTTMKMVNALIQPTTGEVKVRGKQIEAYDLKSLRQSIGYVLQNSALFPNMTIFQNAAIQLEAMKVPLVDRQARIYDLLDRVGLDHEKYANRYPSELSGGEQQRVGIVRALATDPDSILMDEPFSALDPLSRQALQNLVLELHDTLQTTIVFVTHDMNEATRLGTRIGVMADGVLQQVGTPQQIIDNPANQLVASFFNTQQQIVAQDLIMAGFGTPIKEDNTEVPNIDQQTQLHQIADYLLHCEAVTVEGRTQLTVQDVLAYLAHNR